MIKRIVVGIDRGELADHAIVFAMDLAESFGAKLDLVHGAGLEPPLRGIAATARWAEVSRLSLEDSRAACTERVGRVVEHPSYVRVPVEDYLTVTPRAAARAILDFAREHGADLIMIGAHRHRGLFDFGGTGRTILARSECPIWVQPEEPSDIRTILAPIDLSPSSILVLEAARAMAGSFGASVHAMNCFLPPYFAYDGDTSEPSGPRYVIEDARRGEREEFHELVSSFDWKGVPASTICAEGDPWTEILERQDDCDLIVMGTHGRTGLARAVLGSVAYRVLKGSHRAILVVPQPAHAYTEDEP